jgi:hypothetical protein
MLVTMDQGIWLVIDNSFKLKSVNGSLLRISNKQTSIIVNEIAFFHDNRTIFVFYHQAVHNFILNSTTEDTYQLSLEILPGAFTFTTEVQDFSGVHSLKHYG